MKRCAAHLYSYKFLSHTNTFVPSCVPAFTSLPPPPPTCLQLNISNPSTGCQKRVTLKYVSPQPTSLCPPRQSSPLRSVPSIPARGEPNVGDSEVRGSLRSRAMRVLGRLQMKKDSSSAQVRILLSCGPPRRERARPRGFRGDMIKTAGYVTSGHFNCWNAATVHDAASTAKEEI